MPSANAFCLVMSKILSFEKGLKAFEDDKSGKSYVCQIMAFVCDMVENMLGKGENAGNKQFSFSMIFSTPFSSFKLGIAG